MWLGVITLGGFGIRLGTVLGRPGRRPGGDAYYFHNAANLLVEGYGFIDPWSYTGLHPHQYIQTADWPPLFVFVLAITSVVGLKTFFAHRVWCCIIGALAITVCGMTGREIAGRRAGLIAAFLVAVYPNIWMSDELALSEIAVPVARGPRVAGRVPILEATRHASHARPRGRDGSRHPGSRRVGVAHLAHRDPPCLLATVRWRPALTLASSGLWPPSPSWPPGWATT